MSCQKLHMHGLRLAHLVFLKLFVVPIKHHLTSIKYIYIILYLSIINRQIIVNKIKKQNSTNIPDKELKP